MKFNLWRVIYTVLFASLLVLGGCEGDDGNTGAAGPAGPAGAQGPAGPAGSDGADGADGADADGLASIGPESCSVCHDGVGDEHQAAYNEYVDASNLALQILGVASVANPAPATDFTTTMTFSITQNGMPFLDADGLPSMEQKRFYAVSYDSATRTFDNSTSLSNPVSLGGGQYSVSSSKAKFAPELSNAQVYAYVAEGPLHTEQPAGSHVHLYDNVASGGMAFGNAASYMSAANVEGCTKCHGTPYMKHGYRDPIVANLSDFGSCKSCHTDTRDGGHEDWQILVDDPSRYAEIHFGDSLTVAEEAKYAYKAKLMNDVHMAHAMEFPYPQSMVTCATCHAGKLDMILTDAQFTAETCKSCHPVTGPVDASGHLHDEDGDRYTHLHRAPSLMALWEETGTDSFHSMDLTCNDCHKAGGVGPQFSALHTGYDPVIYAADGTRYSDAFVMTVDDAVLNGNTLTIKFHATETVDIPGIAVTDIVPTVMIGLYGYDAIQYRVPSHDRDADGNRLEYAVGSNHARFTTVSAANGMWEVTADLSGHAALIDDDIVKTVEIGVMVDLRLVVGERDSRSNGETDDIIYGMVAPSKTFDLDANAFGGAYADVVDVAKCDKCHDLLATTFHGPVRGGNIKICKMCHGPTTRGSHMEMASREISSYVHAIHSFQPFDPGDVDFTDPVEAMEYDLHVGHVFPNFTIKNCEACHTEGTYNVPDQSRSLPSLHAGTDNWGIDRNIGTIGQFVTGPASRACGACHRAEYLKEDDAGGLASFQQHVKAGGYVVDDGDGVYDAVVEKIMSIFE